MSFETNCVLWLQAAYGIDNKPIVCLHPTDRVASYERRKVSSWSKNFLQSVELFWILSSLVSTRILRSKKLLNNHFTMNYNVAVEFWIRNMYIFTFSRIVNSWIFHSRKKILYLFLQKFKLISIIQPYWTFNRWKEMLLQIDF